MVGDLNRAVDIFLAGGHVGENRGQQVGRAGALDLQGNLLSTPVAQQSQGAIGVPSPAGFKHRREQGCLLQDFFYGILMEKMKDIGQGEAVLLGQSDIDSVVGGRSLQLEVERDAEALAQR